MRRALANLGAAGRGSCNIRFRPKTPKTSILPGRDDRLLFIPGHERYRTGASRMSDFASEAAALRHWLFEAALPLWWEIGGDRRGGGFHEAIDLAGQPIRQPHRARSIARQVFSYCESGRLGWRGPWREAALHALDYLREYFVSADSTVVSVIDTDGRVVDASFDLYNQAFALLAYASGHRSFGNDPNGVGWRSDCAPTLERCHVHPDGGFREAPPAAAI